MKAVIYARYSSDNQREESIEGQVRECLRQHRTTIKKAGTQLKSAYLLLITAARANFIKPASFSCQPDRDSPMRI